MRGTRDTDASETRDLGHWREYREVGTLERGGACERRDETRRQRCAKIELGLGEMEGALQDFRDKDWEVVLYRSLG